MSLYNLVHGYNPLSGLVLAMLATSPEKIPRFRDAYFDGEHLCIHTRTGGGNRDYYETRGGEPCNDDLRALPGFVRDEDNDFDSTYATFYFTLPEPFTWFKKWANDNGVVAASPSERWQEFFAKLNSGESDPRIDRVAEAMRPLFEALKRS